MITQTMQDQMSLVSHQLRQYPTAGVKLDYCWKNLIQVIHLYTTNHHVNKRANAKTSGGWVSHLSCKKARYRVGLPSSNGLPACYCKSDLLPEAAAHHCSVTVLQSCKVLKRSLCYSASTKAPFRAGCKKKDSRD